MQQNAIEESQRIQGAMEVLRAQALDPAASEKPRSELMDSDPRQWRFTSAKAAKHVEEYLRVLDGISGFIEEARQNAVEDLDEIRRELMRGGGTPAQHTANRIQATIQLIEQGEDLCASGALSPTRDEETTGAADIEAKPRPEPRDKPVVPGEFRSRRSGVSQKLAIKAGLDWLTRHQSANGSWEADGFDALCSQKGLKRACGGPGQPEFETGVTGLALMAFLQCGETTDSRTYEGVVAKARDWLLGQQDQETGLIGEKIGHSYMYSHAIATIALVDVMSSTGDQNLRGPCQKAINFITHARNPYSAWRYDVPPTGDNDTSVTGWMIFALKSAEEAGLTIDSQAFTGGMSWIDEVTDKDTGRVAYNTVGSQSSRMDGVNDHYPTDKTECMTAVGLLCRFIMGQNPSEHDIMVKHADLLLEALPGFTRKGLTNDMYYWYLGTRALALYGGDPWKKWSSCIRSIAQHRDFTGCAKGSWDPIGPWGFSGGRVYSTALMVSTLALAYQ
jgi:hypothetical protein